MTKRKIGAICVTLSSLLLSANLALAAPNLSNAQLETSSTHQTLLLPPAADNSPVISLGNAVDPESGKLVEGLAIIHYKDSNAKSNPVKRGRTQCYGFLASGAKWKTTEPWLVNSANTRGLDQVFVFNNLTSNISKWEDAADGTVDAEISKNILGDGSLTADLLAADTQSPDGKNEVYFADVSSSGAIGVTIVWGIFGGPTFQRQLVEWDQVYDDVDFDWSANGEVSKMDFENISTHELGHSGGMDDLYTSTCSDETMYGYAAAGETKKRDLSTGDIAGITQLYK